MAEEESAGTRDAKNELVNLDEVNRLKTTFSQYSELASARGRLSWEVVDTLGMRGYWNTGDISLKGATTHPKNFLWNLRNQLKYPVVRKFLQAQAKTEKFMRLHFRPYAENSWYEIAGRLRNSFSRWSTKDDEKTQMFREENPHFADAKEGECTKMIEPSEFVAKITQPATMAADYVKEFYRNPAAKENRRGWDILVQDAGVWYRRAILDAGFADDGNPYFVLDSNKYLSSEKVASGSAGVAEVTSVRPAVARRFPPRGVSRGYVGDYDVLPVIDGETAKNSFVVIQNPNDPPA